MKVLSWDRLEREPGRVPDPVAITVGVFDGLHIGHQKLIEGIRSASPGTVPVVVTFTRNPGEVLGGRAAGAGPSTGGAPGRILTLQQKMNKMERLGVEWVVLIDFSREISKLTGKEFLEKLKTFFRVRKFVAGYNFSFGRNRDTDVTALRAFLSGSGIELEVVEPTLYRDEVVSSSRIRREISEGTLQQVHSMLGEEYSLDLAGVPETETGWGRIEAPRSGISQLLPPTGVYPVRLVTGRGEVTGRAAITEQTILLEPGSLTGAGASGDESLAGEVRELIFLDRFRNQED